MTPAQKLIAGTVQLLMLLCVLGLIRNGRWRQCITFTLYCSTVVCLEPFQTWYPSKFNVWSYYLAKQSIYEVLKIGMALELAYRALRYFPGAKATAGPLLLVALVGCAFSLPSIQGEGRQYVLSVHAHLSLTTLWLLSITWVVIWRYAILLHPMHRGILSGLAPYVALFSGLSYVVGLFGRPARVYLATFDPLAFLALTVWFTGLAWWRFNPDETLDKVTVRLQQAMA
jgi:hypothetical protein